MDTTNILKLKRKYCLEKFVKVNDEWCPNYSDDTIKVSLNLLYFEKNYVLFRACGQDNMAVDMFFKGTFDECLKVYQEWKNIYDNIPEVVNLKWFLNNGFSMT